MARIPPKSVSKDDAEVLKHLEQTLRMHPKIRVPCVLAATASWILSRFWFAHFVCRCKSAKTVADGATFERKQF
jgi:hypothetical protein